MVVGIGLYMIVPIVFSMLLPVSAIASVETQQKQNVGVAQFLGRLNYSWLDMLNEDPAASSERSRNGNKISREVKSGHYVIVDPTPLPRPQLVSLTPAVGRLLGLDEETLRSDVMITFLSGNLTSLNEIHRSFSGDLTALKSWATPYALSIYGEEMYSNCPFGNGNGYGDGRAHSIAELWAPGSSLRDRWEIQLKGSGRTPFSRSGDGRAVLRSSVREYLASEAMHHLGISTTRGLSLIVSRSETVQRPWFSNSSNQYKKLSIDDPQLSRYTKTQRRLIVREHNTRPDILITEKAAIASRVARSFIRIGHIELYARRYRRALLQDDEAESEFRLSELRLMVEHFLFREFEFSAAESTGSDFETAILEALRACSANIAQMTADWIRVGYCQGNFNSDNCLAIGRTMDYGPFGFIERYEKEWNMWSGGGVHFSFLNQLVAGEKNFISLATSMALLLNGSNNAIVYEDIIPGQKRLAEVALKDVYRRKLGLLHCDSVCDVLVEEIEDLMELSGVDYTIFWRQLAVVTGTLDLAILDDSFQFHFVLDTLITAFYEPILIKNSDSKYNRWRDAILKWLRLIRSEVASHGGHLVDISAAMKRVSPKYIPREWMLERAYVAAADNDFGPLNTLKTIFEQPYEELPIYENEYYRKTPKDSIDRAGISSMT